MKFTKMHGAGNDYVYVDCTSKALTDPESVAVAVSDRHKGVGADGLVLILPSEKADFRMRMFNADGSEAQMCGNASRCVGKYVYDHALTDKTELTLETLAGIRRLSLRVEGSKVSEVSVDMGAPVLSPAQIPVDLPGDSPVIAHPLHVGGEELSFTCVSMGNPHAVFFVDSLAKTDVLRLGPLIELHPLFPQRTNVEFVEVLSPTHLKMRVWERGSGETMACGTGACATVVAGVLNGLCSRECTVSLPGGDLHIAWDEASGHVTLTGEAVEVFSGETL
jgi:diaminopimelate epimerase